jgi:hypothetical protein
VLARRAGLIRHAYVRMLDSIVSAPLDVPEEVPCQAWTFCGRVNLPMSVASMRSLLRNLGAPTEILVASDGTHQRADIQLLERLHPSVRVAHYSDLIRDDLPAAVTRLFGQDTPAGWHVLGKKLAVMISLPVPQPQIYFDSDVLFFPRVAELDLAALRADGRPRFLVDALNSVNEHLVSDPAEAQPPLNAGFLILAQPLSWDSALHRLDRMTTPPSWKTEQTVVHIAVRGAGGLPLPRDRYVLEIDDADSWRDRYAGPRVAMRHYVSVEGVRQKFWLNVRQDLASGLWSRVRHRRRE